MPLSGGGGQKALTDGAPTFFRADQMLPCSRREVWRGDHYSARYHICLFTAGVWATMVGVAIDARRSKKFYRQDQGRARCLSSMPRFLRWTA